MSIETAPIVEGKTPDMVQEATENLPAKLEQLKASATKEYSLKHYNEAAEFYSEAAEIQGQINGEMSIENADLLYQYGRCLYHVAVANSDVLGGKVAGTSEPKRKKRKVAKEAENGEGSSSGLIGDAIKSGEQRLAEDVVEAVVEEKDGAQETQDNAQKSNPFFQITGDENWTDSEDDDEDGEDGPEEEEDDFATAYEILDMARVLLTRKLESLQSDADKSAQEKPEVRQVKERLADTHDLQAEISLENERFADAITDSRQGLVLKMQLYPEESSLIAEAHYKLSLALEFASVTQTQEDSKGESSVAQVDENMRKDAATEMELAIASTGARIAKEEAGLSSLDEKQATSKKKDIAEVKAMLKDMEIRLTDLQKPATAQHLGPAGAPVSDEEAMRGILGSLLGESKAEQNKRLQEATAQANDLSGMVKKKKPKQQPTPSAQAIVEGKGKRKADDIEGGAANGEKKVKLSSAEPEIISEG